MQTNQGDVAIDSNGVAFTLRCTLAACKQVNNYFGNFGAAAEALAKVDFNAFCAVVAAGLGKSIKEVEENVFAAGLANIAKDVREFLDRLANAGIPYQAPKEGDGKDDSGNG